MLNEQKFIEWITISRKTEQVYKEFYEKFYDGNKNLELLETELNQLEMKRNELQPFTFYTHSRHTLTLLFEGNREDSLLLAAENDIDLSSISCSCCGSDWWEGDSDIWLDYDLTDQENFSNIKKAFNEETWPLRGGGTPSVHIFRERKNVENS